MVGMDGWESTWIGGLVAWLGANIPIVVGAAILVSIVWGVWGVVTWIATGEGSYGIIEGYVGTIGAGKTTLAVQHALRLATMRNAVLLSNIPVVCGPRCKEGTHAIEHRSLPVNDDGIDLAELTRQAFALRDAQRGLVLLMDEVGVIMPARLWKDMSVALMWVLQQSRKLACEWIWTAQDVSFVDGQLRSLTSVVHYVKAMPPPSVRRRVQGRRPWLMLVTTYAPSQAPRAHGETDRQAERRKGRYMIRYRRKWEAAFDTDGVVLPSKHLKGAEILRGAVLATGDSHVLDTSSWGPKGDAAPEGDPA